MGRGARHTKSLSEMGPYTRSSLVKNEDSLRPQKTVSGADALYGLDLGSFEKEMIEVSPRTIKKTSFSEGYDVLSFHTWAVARGKGGMPKKEIIDVDADADSIKVQRGYNRKTLQRHFLVFKDGKRLPVADAGIVGSSGNFDREGRGHRLILSRLFPEISHRKNLREAKKLIAAHRESEKIQASKKQTPH